MAYPTSTDSFSTKVDNVDDVLAADINSVQDAAVALETKIGTGASTPTNGTALLGTGTGTSAWGAISTDPAVAIHAATGKTTPVNADEFGIVDSAASNVLKKLTWANLKATLKTYFDSLTTTFTNKRITPRTDTVASSATPTINTDTTDIFTITALATAITSMTSGLSGTPTIGQKLIIQILDNGTARSITWGASFASRGATLPTTTVLGKYLYVGFIWNSVASVWDCVALSVEA